MIHPNASQTPQCINTFLFYYISLGECLHELLCHTPIAKWRGPTGNNYSLFAFLGFLCLGSAGPSNSAQVVRRSKSGAATLSMDRTEPYERLLGPSATFACDFTTSNQMLILYLNAVPQNRAANPDKCPIGLYPLFKAWETTSLSV